MSLELTYRQASCVLLTPDFVPEIVTHPDVVTAVGGRRRTQFLETEEVVAAFYGTLQIVCSAQPLGQAPNISITEMSEDWLVRLGKVALAAFRLATKSKDAVAVGVNFQATAALPGNDAKALVFGLLNPKIVSRDNSHTGELTNGGVRLVYANDPWTVTIAIETDAKQEGQVACNVNFNIDKPSSDEIALIEQVAELRTWFEETVKSTVEAINA